MGINNPLMRTMAVEEAVNKKYTWDTHLLRNDREAPREAPKKNATLVPGRYSTTLNST